MSLLFHQLESHVSRRPMAAALIESGPDGKGPALSWRQLRSAASALAAQLRRQVPPGAVVVLIAPNAAQSIVAYFGCMLADVTLFPLSPHLCPLERREAARRSGAQVCIGDAEAIRALDGVVPQRWRLEDVPLDGDDATAVAMFRLHRGDGAFLLQSSGTTGLPKIVRRSMQSMVVVGDNCRRAVGITEDDRLLAVAPICHPYGIDHAVLAAPLAGAAVEICPRFDAAHARQALAGGASVFPAVPFIFDALARTAPAPLPLPRLRQAYSAGSPLPASVFDAFLRAFNVPVGQIYGSTEFGSITFNDPHLTPFDPSSVGRPMAGVRVVVLDREQPDLSAPLPVGSEGQIAVGASSLLTGYLDDPACPYFAGGFFLAGDLGRMDDDQRLHLTGRLKLLIDVGGLKVNPLEVETVLAQHPAVREAAVVGVALSETVTRVKAIIVWHGSAGDVESLRQFARQRLAAFKVPRVFEERSSLPRTATGKLLRSALQTI